MKVPLSFAPKDKIIARLKQDPAIDRETAITLPRMSFEYLGAYYNGDRKLPKINRYVRKGDDADHVFTQFVPVAYDFNFRLYVYAKNTEDNLKIVEQILPFFTPDYTPTVHLIPEINLTIDIPISLKSVYPEDNYEGDFTADRRAQIWTLDFNLQGYLYGPVIEKPLIKFVVTNFYTDTANTGDVVDRLTIQPGLTANGEPTSNSVLSIDPHLIWFDDDWGVVKTTTIAPNT